MSNIDLPPGYVPDTLRSHLKRLYTTLRFKQNDFRHYRIQWERVSGWLMYKQARWLFNQASDTSLSGDIVEIGSAYGRSAVCLAWGTRLVNNGKVYAVDPHIGGKGFRESLGAEAREYSSLELFKHNIQRFNLQNWVEPIVATSEAAVQNWTSTNIRLLFIDGWHTYEAVKHDILMWSRYVKPGGIIALHDYQIEEIQQAIADSMRELNIPQTALQHVDETMVYFQLPDA